MTILLFQQQFIEPIRRGTKTQTIRRFRRRLIEPGSKLSLRAWTAAAYRSPQGLIRPDPVTCLSVEHIEMDFRLCSVRIAGSEMKATAFDAFARRDGFKHFAELLDYWLRQNSGLTFEGQLIRWAT